MTISKLKSIVKLIQAKSNLVGEGASNLVYSENDFSIDISFAKNIIILDAKKSLGEKKQYDMFRTLNELNKTTWVGNGKHHLIEDKENNTFIYWFAMDMYYRDDKVEYAAKDIKDWICHAKRAIKYGYDVLASDTELEAKRKIMTYSYDVMTPKKNLK